MLRKLLLGIGPWFVFSMVLRFGSLELINLAWISFFLLQTWFGWTYLKAGNPLSWMSTIVFSALFLNSYFQYSYYGIVYAAPICYGLFAITALLTVLVGKPFTLTHARLHTPSEYWQHPIFMTINRHIALFWCAGFAFNGLVMLAEHQFPWLRLACTYCSLACGIVLSDKYPNYYRSQAMAKMATAQS